MITAIISTERIQRAAQEIIELHVAAAYLAALTGHSSESILEWARSEAKKTPFTPKEIIDAASRKVATETIVDLMGAMENY